MRETKSTMTGEKRDSRTGTFPGQRPRRGQNYRETKIKRSVKSLLLVCPTLEVPMKSRVTEGSSTNPRMWTVGLQVEKMKFTVYDQAWRGRDMAQRIYRPSKNLDKDMYGDDLETRIKTNRFVPD